mgnify:FL=1
MKKKVSAKNAPKEISAYSNAIKVGNVIYVSGQLPVNPETGKIPEGIQAQTMQVIENVRNILADAGATLDNVVKTTVILSEMYLFSEMNEIYAREFKEPYPARTSMAVKEIPQNTLIQFDVIAVLD